MRARRTITVLALAAVAGCTEAAGGRARGTGTGTGTTGAGAGTHVRVDGRDFPDHVIALTWDDGPDASTLALAQYLKTQRVAATFFVVSAWIDGVSSEPGAGEGVFDSGYARLPILADLVSLGHRLGNHTAHHVLLGEADAGTVARELTTNQRSLDPFLTNELRLFRAPGGSWSREAARAVDSDPDLATAIGPLHWDIDEKDWDASLACRSVQARAECEAAPPWAAARVRPGVIARRYLAAIEAAGHGIVLLHDRVGHVGSRYALDVARELVPRLAARGFVFAAPLLRFSPLTRRTTERFEALAIRDVDRDGRGDLCDAAGCALAVTRALPGDLLPRVAFGLKSRARARDAEARSAVQLADVDGDGRADACARADGAGVVCARGAAHGFGEPERWSEELRGDLRFGDINGDGRADACAHDGAHDGAQVVCALSTGRSFTRPTAWLTERIDASRWALGDVSGDGRADLCAGDPDGVRCGLAP